MKSKRKKFWSDKNRFRLMVLAVVLPAVSLIYFNFSHLKSIKRNKVLEAAFPDYAAYRMRTARLIPGVY